MRGIIAYMRRSRWLQAMALSLVISILVGCAAGSAAAPSGGAATLVPLEIPMNDLPLTSSPVIGAGSSLTADDDDDSSDVAKSWYKTEIDGFLVDDAELCSGDDLSECPFTEESSQGYCETASRLASVVDGMKGADFQLCMMRSLVATADVDVALDDGTSRHARLDVTDIGSYMVDGMDVAESMPDSMWIQMNVDDDVITLADMRLCEDNVQTEYYRHTLNDSDYTLEAKNIRDEATHILVEAAVSGEGHTYSGEKEVLLRHRNADGSHQSKYLLEQSASSLVLDGFSYDLSDDGDGHSYSRQYAIAGLVDRNSSQEIDNYEPGQMGIRDGEDRAIFEVTRQNQLVATRDASDEWDGDSTRRLGAGSETEPMTGAQVPIAFDEDEAVSCSEGYDLTISLTTADIEGFIAECGNYLTADASFMNCNELVGDEDRIIVEGDVDDEEEEVAALEISSVTMAESGGGDGATAELTQSSNSPESFAGNLASIDIVFSEAVNTENVQVNTNVYVETYQGGDLVTMGSSIVSDTTVRLITTSALQSGQTYRVVVRGSDDIPNGSAAIDAQSSSSVRIQETQYYYVSID